MKKFLRKDNNEEIRGVHDLLDTINPGMRENDPSESYIPDNEVSTFRVLFTSVIAHGAPDEIRNLRDYIARYSDDGLPQPSIALEFMRRARIEIDDNKLLNILQKFQNAAHVTPMPISDIMKVNRWTIQSAAGTHYLKTGSYVDERTGPILWGNIADGRRTWENIDIALQNKSIADIPKKTCLRDFLIESGLAHHACRFTLTEDFISEHMWKYYQKHNNRFPNSTSGKIDDMPGETWDSWNKALNGNRFTDGRIKRIRGLSGGSSLHKLAIKKGWCLEDLTEKIIAEHIWKYFEKHGKFPNRDSGPVDGLPGETWRAWDSALSGRRKKDGSIERRRGLPGGSSLHKLAIKKGWCLEDLTEKIIAEHIWKYFEKHGKFPNRDSGPVDGLPGETWKAWDKALAGNRSKGGRVKSLRGLRGGSSLSIFIKSTQIKMPKPKNLELNL